jgi:hypothetical protein
MTGKTAKMKMKKRAGPNSLRADALLFLPAFRVRRFI